MLAQFFVETIRTGLPIMATVLGTHIGGRKGVKWGVVGAAAGWSVGYVGSRLLLTVFEGGEGPFPKYAVTPPAQEPLEPPKSVDETLKGMETKQASVGAVNQTQDNVVQMPSGGGGTGAKKPKVQVTKTGPPEGFGFHPGGSV